MIVSVKGTATRQFIETGKSKFSGLNQELADQRLQELDSAMSLESFTRLRSVGLHKLTGDRRASGRSRSTVPGGSCSNSRKGMLMTSKSSITTETFEAPPGGFRLRPVHPGRSIQSQIEARGLTAHALALKLRVPANRITEIINGKRGVSAETALRLGRYFGTGAAFWMNLQSRYDLAVAERDLGERVEREVEAA